ncbi:glycerate kinase type-2 family protein [Alloalcanivorax mobilis]|uniref:glycerate kinase type-2 family protein n=1 Tax=Alloalcanivorax mobilis TaxID=2019569 RepID=UPI000C771CCE|nr:glycerate kinase [Alloalcanivorax mobilis]
MDNPKAFLKSLFDAAVAAALPERCLPAHLPEPAAGRTVVIGAGKAAARMAAVLEKHWLEQHGRSASETLSGLVVTAYGQAVPTRFIEVLEAAHPVPDEAGERAARRMLEKVAGLTADDQVIALISGGGSSLLPLPAPGLTLDDKQTLGRALLRSGATIGEINTVRRHLSAIKGGHLAAACHPAAVTTLLISDVPGDRPWEIASGPTVGDPTTCDEALAIIDRYAIEVPSSLRAHLKSGRGETLKPGDARLAGGQTRIIASAQHALEAAADAARAAGITPLILGDALEGEARELGRVMAGIATQVRRHGQPLPAPCVLLSGGETTVTVRGEGVGGRNVEALLGFGLALTEHAGIHALFADTDGIDGGASTAGALWTPTTLERAHQAGLDPRGALHNNDAHPFFATLGDDLVSGATGTNVNDFRAVLILP